MRNKRMLPALLLVLLLLFSLGACSQSDAGTDRSPPADTVDSAQTSSDKGTQEDQSADTGTVEFTDGAGRTVTIPTPENLERIYADTTNSLVLLYILDTELFTASPTVFTEDDLPYVAQSMLNLPTYGTMSGSNGALDYEAIKEADVQLIVTSFYGNTLTESDIQQADDLQEQLGIPVIAFGTQMEALEQSFTLLGQALGREERAQEVIDYFNAIVEKVANVVESIPEEERLTVYYAEGNEGLATEPGNSNRSIVFNMCGLTNVATVEALEGFGQSSVSMEAVLSWDPEVIVVQNGTGAYETITTSEDWASVTAVQEGRVYEMPSDPFGWADRPAGPNRYIGLLWLADLLYPEEMNIDFTETVIDYYKVIYQVDITAEDVDALLVNAMGSK